MDDEQHHDIITFDDIIGHGEVKLKMKQVLQPLLLPEHLVRRIFVGVRATASSILLHGPPGCGKTKLAQAMTAYLDAALLTVSPSDILSSNMGESEQNLRNIFDQAAHMAIPTGICLIFLDEIDAIGQTREGMAGGGDGIACSRRVLVELMLQLTQLSDNNHMMDIGTGQVVRIFVVAATNRRDDCDAALLRRFGSQIFVGLPDETARRQIIEKYLCGIPHSLSVDELEEVASWTEGFSGSDIESFIREAAFAPIHECMELADSVRLQVVHNSHQAVGVSSAEVELMVDVEAKAREALIKAYESIREVNFNDVCQAFNTYCAGRNIDREIAVSTSDIPIVSPEHIDDGMAY